jgi:small subunit ribosomal protein S20
LKTQVRKLKRALESSDATAAKDLLKPTISVLDKSVQKGVLKKNTASRLKSRLTRRVRGLATAKA